jgi:hypothetical protein
MYVEQGMLEGTLCELHEKCPNKHYFYSYAYGHTEVIIGEQEFSTHHDAPFDMSMRFTHDINAAIKDCREKYAKDNPSK